MDFVGKFREALKIPTWWPPGTTGDTKAAEAVLLRFQDFLAEHFPAFHAAAERRQFGPCAVVYRLPGEEKMAGGESGKTGAVLLLAHYDVVPAETEKWSADPFGAEMRDGFIYGRGSLDMKNTLMSLMEAAELLCTAGRKPKHDIWFAFGGDEERTGLLGAAEAANWFRRQGLRFDWILDEGTPIAENQMKGINVPLALVGVEEKGYLSLELSVDQEPGHASRPPKIQAAAVLGRALCRIDKRPFPYKLGRAAELFFKAAAVYMPPVQGFVMRHARALGPLFFMAAASSPAVKSMLRTTMAITQLEGSAADNVLPSRVRAVINLRLLHPWTVETVTAFISNTVNDSRVKIGVYGLGTDPVPPGAGINLSGGRTFAAEPEIAAAMEKAWPGIPLLPFIMVATTDSRHYQDLSEKIYRFSPYKLDPAALGGIHGHDECISEENLRRGLVFYTTLLESL